MINDVALEQDHPLNLRLKEGLERASLRSSHAEKALELLGKAVHALADSYAPPHAGFQEWAPPYWVAVPIPGIYDFWDYVDDHTSLETFAHYTGMRSTVDSAIINRFRADFLYIIQE